MLISKEQLENPDFYWAGVNHMQREMYMEGTVTIGEEEITSADMVDIMGRKCLNNIALMLLVDPGEAREELRILVVIAVLSFCEATPKYAVQYALEQDLPIIDESKFKDGTKLGLSPSTIIENIDCRKH